MTDEHVLRVVEAVLKAAGSGSIRSFMPRNRAAILDAARAAMSEQPVATEPQMRVSGGGSA